MSFLSNILTHLQARCDDDLVDRLNYYYTSSLLILFAVLVSAKQYVGYPIQCWVPARFTEAMEQYTENYCWVQNTWWHPLHEYVPKQHFLRDDQQLVYYQWVPFILAFEAVLFYLPAFFWRMLNWQSGIYIEDIVQMAKDSRALVEYNSRIKAIFTTSRYLEDAITMNKSLIRKRGHKPATKATSLHSADESNNRREIYVTSLYFAIKLGFVMNLFLQYFMLDYFLGTGELLFGPRLLMNLIHGKKGFEWQGTGMFPRVTLCDFEVKVTGNLHRHTVQCVLMINMFNEKIFLFLWFWYAFLLLVTLSNLIYWIITLLLASRRTKFVLKYMRIGQIDYHEAGTQTLNDFIFGFLKLDGLFVLRLIGAHAGDIILTEVLVELWFSFLSSTEEGGAKGNYLMFSRYNRGSDENLSYSLGANPTEIDVGMTTSTSVGGDSDGEVSSVAAERPKMNGGKGMTKFNRDPSEKLSNSGTQWAVAGSRIMQKQVLNPMPIYKQQRFMRMEKKKGQY